MVKMDCWLDFDADCFEDQHIILKKQSENGEMHNNSRQMKVQKLWAICLIFIEPPIHICLNKME